MAKVRAAKAFALVIGKIEFDQLMAGLENYKHGKPAYAAWCHATTWLNQERWQDEWPPPDHSQRPHQANHHSTDQHKGNPNAIDYDNYDYSIGVEIWPPERVIGLTRRSSPQAG